MGVCAGLPPPAGAPPEAATGQVIGSDLVPITARQARVHPGSAEAEIADHGRRADDPSETAGRPRRGRGGEAGPEVDVAHKAGPSLTL